MTSKPATVLVIEDDASVGPFVARSLRERCLVVDLTDTAKEAETLVLETGYAAIVLDLGLPDKDGLQ